MCVCVFNTDFKITGRKYKTKEIQNINENIKKNRGILSRRRNEILEWGICNNPEIRNKEETKRQFAGAA